MMQLNPPNSRMENTWVMLQVKILTASIDIAPDHQNLLEKMKMVGVGLTHVFLVDSIQLKSPWILDADFALTLIISIAWTKPI